MRSALIGSATGAFLLLLSTAAYADPPPGVGAAITDSGIVCLVGVVVESDEVLPILPGGFGIMQTQIGENTKIVYSNSANGNITVSCHGRIESGTTVEGVDFITGQPATGTVAQFDEACDALGALFPDICRGKGAAIITVEDTGTECNIDLLDGVTTVFTPHWQQVTTPSGQVALECQYLEE